MDMSSGDWLSNLANEDPEAIIDHCQMMMRSLVDDDEFNDIFQPSDMNLSSKKSGVIKSEGVESTWEPKITPISSDSTSWSSPGQLISFGSSEFETSDKPNSTKKEASHQWRKRVAAGSLCTEEHVAAERRRREKMTQGFVALSALIPGLKKMDKASILAETTEYLKQLEERAKLLEQQTTKRTVESVCFVNNTQSKTLVNNNNGATNSSSNGDYFNTTINPDDLLEIDARIFNNDVLIRIHSLKKQGLIQTILGELRRLNVTTLNCHTTPFGSYALDITIIAKVNDEFRMTTEELVKCLEKPLKSINALNV